MRLRVSVGNEVRERVFGHVDVGMDVGFDHAFEVIGVHLEKLLVLHDSCIVYNYSYSLFLIKKLAIL